MEDVSRSIWLDLSLILVLVIVNGFFAASEMAIVSVNKTKINHLANAGNKKAKLLSKLIEEPSKFLATIQVGVTLAGFFASASAAVSISKVFEEIIKNLNIDFLTVASGEISLTLVTVIIAYITLVLGELVPKRLALQNAEQIAYFSAKPILIISKIASPFIKILTVSTNLVAMLLGSKDDNVDEKVTEEEIRMIIDVGEEKGVINSIEKEMIDSIFRFDNTISREVMTPRTNVFTIDIDTPIEEIIDLMIDEQYSRVPVYEEDIDNIIGILYIKDLILNMRKMDIDKICIRGMLRDPYFVPETKNIDVLFRELQQSKNHMAILIDEYGGFTGILTIEDLIEEIVGNISDEHDEDIKEIERIDENTYIIDGLVTINELNEKLDLKLPSDIYDTIGGFVVNILGKIPKENEKHSVEYENLMLEIEKINEKRIEKIKLYIQEEL